MKIAMLRQRVAGPGGAETTVQHLARGLAAAGHQVAVYGSDTAETARAALSPEVGYVPVPVWPGKTGRLLSYALGSRWLLEKARPQVVFSLERTLSPQVYRAGDGCHREWLRLRTPFLSPAARAFQDLSLFHRVMLALEERLFTDSGLRRVIANSQQVKEEIIRHYQLEPQRLAVIYNGIDRRRFRPLEEPQRAALKAELGASSGPIVLFAGSGFGRKGLTYLLEAFGGLRQKEVVLWVVGKGEPASYERQARRSGAASPRQVLGTPGRPGALLPGRHGVGPAHHLRSLQQRGPGGLGQRAPGDHHRGQRRRRVPAPRWPREGPGASR